MRLAIIEESHALLENLRLILNGEQEITVVGAFRSAEDALRRLKRIAPDIVLTDVGLSGMSGIEFIKQARAGMPKLEVLVQSTADDWKTVSSAFNAGAMGYIIKGAKPRTLVEALLELYDGGAPMSPRIARMMITALHTPPNESTANDLSPREKEVLGGLEKNMTYREIAEALLVSPHTVRTHIRNIYEKLPANSKTEALRLARKNGLV